MSTNISGNDHLNEFLDEADVPVLVDFWADWCQPCKMVEPELETVKEELGEDVKIAKVDVDEQESLARSYDVRSIPLLLLFHNGTERERFEGVKKSGALIRAIKNISEGPEDE